MLTAWTHGRSNQRLEHIKGSSDFGVGYAITVWMAGKLPWRVQGSVVGASGFRRVVATP
jgi:hypothetical protein